MVIRKHSKSDYARLTSGAPSTKPLGNSTAASLVRQVKGTPQQDAVWDAMLHGTSNIVVDARAGTGKTFTFIHGLKLMALAGKLPRSVIAVAFNQSIAAEMKTKVPQGVDASTMHSFGYAAIRRGGMCRVNPSKTYYTLLNAMGRDRAPFQLSRPLDQLVSLCKGNMLSGTPDELDDIVAMFDVNLYDNREEVYSWVPQILEASLANRAEVDYDDMIWMPAKVPGMLSEDERKDFMIVDEAQDLNPAQHILALRAAKRLMLVGDPRQAIYGFRGADVESIPKLTKALAKRTEGVTVLPLTQTRRCPLTHVLLSRQLVPDFEPLPDCPLGTIHVVTAPGYPVVDHMDASTLVVCRVNAPLVKLAFQLIRADKRVRIQGRKFGEGLLTLVKFLAGPAGCDTTALVHKIETYRDRENVRLSGVRNSERQIETLNDKCDCLIHLCEACEDSAAVLIKIDTLFSGTVADEDAASAGSRTAKPRDYVLLSSVHRAKGLEAERVMVLAPEKMPHVMAKQDWEKEQELNIAYVACTRSLSELWFLGGIPSCFNAADIIGSGHAVTSTPYGYVTVADTSLRPVNPVSSSAVSPTPSASSTTPTKGPSHVQSKIPRVGKVVQAAGQKAIARRTPDRPTQAVRKPQAKGSVQKVRPQSRQAAQQGSVQGTPGVNRRPDATVHGSVPPRRQNVRPARSQAQGGETRPQAGKQAGQAVGPQSRRKAVPGQTPGKSRQVVSSSPEKRRRVASVNLATKPKEQVSHGKVKKLVAKPAAGKGAKRPKPTTAKRPTARPAKRPATCPVASKTGGKHVVRKR